jgi:ribokinase
MKNFDVVTIGRSTIDVLLKVSRKEGVKEEHHQLEYHLGGKFSVDEIDITTGGGATNTAVALSRLGLRVGCITVVGNDSNGKIITEELAKERVSFMGAVKKGMTGYSTILPGRTDRAILVYSGVNSELEMKDLSLREVRTKWVYLSTLKGKGFETVKELSKRFRTQGSRIAMSMSSYSARLGIEKLRDLLSRLDIIIMNRDELTILTKSTKIREAMEKLGKYVKGLIVVTDGPNPIHMYNSINEESVTKKLKAVKVVDSTGAGDAFSSGFLYAIIKGIPASKALDYGYALSRAKLQKVGAKAGLLRRIRV